jgi:hypothetical protein
MGFLSSITKGIKNIFKGVAKVVKKVFKGVKEFASSKLGKVLIGAAAIYFGGAALGAWGGGSAAATSTAATQLASTTIPTAAAGTAAAGTAATAAELGTLASSGLTGASAGSLATGMGNLAVTGAGTAANTGLMSQIASGASAAAKYAAANPAVTLAGGQVASSLFAPSQAQTAEEMEELRRKNSNIAGVGYDGSGSPINLSLSQRAQQGDLRAPTYNNSFVPGGG